MALELFKFILQLLEDLEDCFVRFHILVPKNKINFLFHYGIHLVNRELGTINCHKSGLHMGMKLWQDFRVAHMRCLACSFL